MLDVWEQKKVKMVPKSEKTPTGGPEKKDRPMWDSSALDVTGNKFSIQNQSF